MSETIGVVGAGRMGLPIIGHLARKGFRTIATDANGAKKSRLESSHSGFAQRLAACGSDSCRRETYLKHNVEISRIMMGE